MAVDTEAVRELLAAHPAFERKVLQFMALYDAAEIIGELKPPYGDTAAEYLREVGAHIMRDAGIPDELVQAMIRARPSFG